MTPDEVGFNALMVRRLRDRIEGVDDDASVEATAGEIRTVLDALSATGKELSRASSDAFEYANARDKVRLALRVILRRINEEEKDPHNDYGDVGACIDEIQTLARTALREEA